MDVILGPDVFVNASVSLGTPPEQVVQRVLGQPSIRTHASPWLLTRVEAMIRAVPSFREEQVGPHMDRIRELVNVVDVPGEFDDEAWKDALLALAKQVGAERIITDHPDLTDSDAEGVQFMSTDAWIVERTIPPPPPGS